MRPGHLVAGVAALALLFVMALDWYGTVVGDEFREFERQTEGSPQLSEENEDAAAAAEGEEKNAWQADAMIDRVILALLLLTVALALVTAFTRSMGAKPTGGIGPAGLTAIVATVSALLVAYRIVQEPGLDAATQVKIGAPLALLPLAAIAIGMSSALRADENERDREARR